MHQKNNLIFITYTSHSVQKRVRDWSTGVPPVGGMRALPEVRKARQNGNRSATPGRNLKSAGRVLQTQAAKHGKQNCMAVLRRDQTWKRAYNAWSQVTAEENNAGQNWTYAYDRRGLAVRITDPNGTVTDTVYDKAGRQTAETKTNGTAVNSRSWEYDEGGFMNAASDNGTATYINYRNGEYLPNAWDAVTNYETTAGGKILATAYTYDKGLHPLTVSYPDSVSVSCAYNGLGQLTGIEGYASDGQYDNAGHLIQLNAGDGTSRTENWNTGTNMLDGYSWNVDGKAPRMLTWDTRGNITGISKDGYSNTYYYDSLNRLAQEQDGNPVDVSSKTTAQYGAAYSDVGGRKALDIGLADSTIKFDYYASSVGMNLLTERKINKIALTGKSSRLNKRTVEVYAGTDGTDGQKAIASYTYDIRGLQVESVKKQQVEFCRRRLQNSGSRTAQQFCGALHVRRAGQELQAGR